MPDTQGPNALRDRRLTGIRLNEAHAPGRVKHWRNAPEPKNLYSWEWIRWSMGSGYERWVNALDALQAWENEGGR